MMQAFLEGLPSRYRLYMRFETYVNLSDAFAVARDAARKEELEKERLGPDTQARNVMRPHYPNQDEPPSR